MARHVKVFLSDDIDGSADASTVEFSLGKDSYTIDLTEKNIAKLEAALAPFIDKATKTGRKPAVKKQPAARKSSDNNAIREWARANGRTVSDRGRIPSEVIEAYEAAH